ncbi:MAG TPA: helix-turn-helix domain-containing protein [Opitutaceae bacterium]|nr:helix-turn-helix domain-containing protein [Opitutaceae bacterium]
MTLDLLGDRWSLLILRDMMFAGKRHYREFLQSDEGIASNILAERLTRLVDAGILTKSEDPTHLQKAIYSLTPMGIDLLPVLAQIGIWGRKHMPVTPASSAVAGKLAREGDRLIADLTAKLKREHLAPN